MYGYIHNFPHGAIHFCTNIPNHKDTFGPLPSYFAWQDTVYGPISEEIPTNAPAPLGKPARHTCFFDANMHDMITRHSAMGLLHLLNQTPSAWTSTCQNQVETATYGLEFMAVCQAVEQTIDLCYTLHMFSVLLDGPSWLLVDNQAVINSTMIPHSSLSKHWNALSYHCCHESMAASICWLEYLLSMQNPSDVLTKNLPWAKASAFIEPFLLRKGETTSNTTHQRGVTG